MSLPTKIIQVLRSFEGVFSQRVWEWAKVLLIGAILVPGERTVASILRVMWNALLSWYLFTAFSAAHAVVPPFYAKALPTLGGDPSGSVTPQWSPESAIDYMDAQEIATGILSLSTPSVVGWDAPSRREMARRVNEYMADFVSNSLCRGGGSSIWSATHVI